jgi:hypothetical protein
MTSELIYIFFFPSCNTSTTLSFIHIHSSLCLPSVFVAQPTNSYYNSFCAVLLMLFFNYEFLLFCFSMCKLLNEKKSFSYLHSDGKVRVYRLSSAIRRLSQESRWQLNNNRRDGFPLSNIPMPRNRFNQRQKVIMNSIKIRREHQQ